MLESQSYIESNYFYRKCIFAIAYCKEPRKFIGCLFNGQSIHLDPKKMCDVLDTFLVDNYYLDGKARSNLQLLIRFLKNSVGEERSFKSIEKGISDNSLDYLTKYFIMDQYQQRLMLDNQPKYLVSDKETQDESFELLKLKIVNDLKILVTHSEKCDAVTFNNSISSFVSDPDSCYEYICSIGMIIQEYPEILKNDTFVSKMEVICSNIKSRESSDSVQKIYTKFENKKKVMG